MAEPSRICADFGDAQAEYETALRAAAIFDVSNRGKIELVGPEAPNFLQNMCTNDVLNLPLGAGCEAFFTTSTAKVVGHALIYHVRIASGDDALWLDVAPGEAPRLIQHLERYHIAERFEISDRTEDFAQIHVAGPQARDMVQRSVGEAIPDLAPLEHMERSIGEVVCNIRRNDPLGVPGYDLVCLRARGPEIWSALAQIGAAPAGTTAYEILRVEAGTPVIGLDMDESRFVVEVGRAHAICHTKGCYLGQEPIVMARDRAGHVNRSLRGLKLGDGPAAAAKSKLFNEAGQDVGMTTSSVISPRFGPIALAYIRRGFESPGTQLHLDTVAGRTAQVTALPIT